MSASLSLLRNKQAKVLQQQSQVITKQSGLSSPVRSDILGKHFLTRKFTILRRNASKLPAAARCDRCGGAGAARLGASVESAWRCLIVRRQTCQVNHEEIIQTNKCDRKLISHPCFSRFKHGQKATQTSPFTII